MSTKYRVSSDLPRVKEIDSNDRKAESRNRAARCSALCRNGTTIKMVGTTFYRLSSRLSDDVDDDDGSGQRSLTFASITVGGPPTFKGGTNLKDEIHHHDQLRPPPTRCFTGRGNGMQDVAAAAATAALAPPLPPGEGCTLGEPGGFLPQDISAGDCVTTLAYETSSAYTSRPRRLSTRRRSRSISTFRKRRSHAGGVRVRNDGI